MSASPRPLRLQKYPLSSLLLTSCIITSAQATPATTTNSSTPRHTPYIHVARQQNAAPRVATPLSDGLTSTATAPKEQITVHIAPISPTMIYPHATPVGQPVRTTGAQGRLYGRQYDWGVFNRGNGEAAGFGPVGRYGIAPWAEDWSRLRQTGKRSDPFDILKFIPLNKDGSVWLSFSGETRARNWFESRPGLGTQKVNDSGRFAVRNLYGADLHLGSHVRLFGQLINGNAGGWRPYSYGSTYRKKLDMQQAFIEFKWTMLHAKSGFLFGRQQFVGAPSYMMYNRETPNVPLSWNGFRGYMVWPRFRIDGWDFVQTDDSHNKMFHDGENYNNRLYGFNFTWAPPDGRFMHDRTYSFLDLFYIGYKLAGRNSAVATPTNGSSEGFNTRNNFGVRWHGLAGPFEFSLGGIWQGGVFRYARTNQARNVSGYAINTLVGYRIPKNPFHTFLGLQTDVYSGGNKNKTSGTIGTYISPFNPQTNYLDTTTYMTGSNLISFAPLIKATFLKSVSLQVKYPLFWRYSTQDPIYKSSGFYKFTQDFNGKFIGMAPQAALAWQITDHLSWTQYVSRFMTSHALNKAGGSSGTYYQSNFVFRF